MVRSANVVPMNMQIPSRRTAPDDRRGAALRPVGHERFRSRTADVGHRTPLADAVATFDELVVDARQRGLTDRSDVRAAFGDAVDAIARAIQRVPHVGGPTGDVAWVLVDRASARFASRVSGTELGRRPSPAPVLASLDRVRQAVAAWS